MVQIWYMKPEWFSQGVLGKIPIGTDLSATHIHLKDVPDQDLEVIFRGMQGEVWSPNGEARELLDSKGLSHTSMTVGDVVVKAGRVYIVRSIGFYDLGPVV